MGDGRDPVSRSELSQRGKSLAPVPVSAREGLHSNVADVERLPSQAKVLHNMQMHKRRYIWTPRGTGFTHTTASALNSGAKILGFGRFVDSSGALNLLVQAGSILGSYVPGTDSFTNIVTGLHATNKPCMRGYAPSTSTAQAITIWVNGDSEPKKVTAVNASSALAFNAGNWPGTFASKTYSKPRLCEGFGDRMVFAGFGAADTQFDILISDQGDSEDFTISAPVVATDAVALAAYPELGALTALKAFSPSGSTGEQVLIIGQERGISIITGTNATNYRIDILTDHHGIVNNNVIANVLNDLIYLGSAGIFRLSNVATGNTLPNSAESWPIDDFIQLIDYATIGDAHVCHHALTHEVQFWIPFLTESGTVQHALIWNYNTPETQAGILKGLWSTKDGFSIAASIDFKNVMYGGGYTGHIQKHYNGDTQNGTPILYRFLSALIGVGNPSQTFRCKNIEIICDGTNQKFQASAYYHENQGNKTNRLAAEPFGQLLEAPQTGTFTFPASFPLTFAGDRPRIFNFRPKVHGRFMELEIQGSGTADSVCDFNSALATLSIGGFAR